MKAHHLPLFLSAAAVLLCMVAAGRDFYELMDVPRDAPASVIKKSYRRLARLYHPDKHPGDKKMEEKFKQISEAYEVLANEEKRRTYDQFGEDGLKGNAGAGGAGFHHPGFGGEGFRMEFDSSMFNDFFTNGFGHGFGGGFGGFDDGFRGRRHRPPPRRQKVCFQNKVCENGKCFMVQECK